jgi:hypothetical protein
LGTHTPRCHHRWCVCIYALRRITIHKLRPASTARRTAPPALQASITTRRTVSHIPSTELRSSHSRRSTRNFGQRTPRWRRRLTWMNMLNIRILSSPPFLFLYNLCFFSPLAIFLNSSCGTPFMNLFIPANTSSTPCLSNFSRIGV